MTRPGRRTVADRARSAFAALAIGVAVGVIALLLPV
jgi:hypothetical protein